MERLIIDTDPGIDDAAALFWALAADEFQVEAITTVFGNVDVDTATRNMHKILAVAGRTGIPVHKGAARPLVGEPNFAEHIHRVGGLGFWDFPEQDADSSPTRTAAKAIVDAVMAEPGELTIMALGPLTNVALALTIEPKVAQSVRRIIYMGGAALTWGNVTPVASANIYNDPEAAHILVRSGAPLTQVGLDVSRQFALSVENLEGLWTSGSDAARALCEMIGYPDNQEDRLDMPEWKDEGMHLNDVPCIAYAINPGWFEVRHLHVDIELHGEFTRGQTVVHMIDRWKQTPNVDVLLGIDTPAVARSYVETVGAQRGTRSS
ncbi:nucleoside hydrolase [Georgenia sp. Z1491]|uniref:nucleoside hydrolase n=1 Tax=Georgenia sp. Z1491 TaxID=3416707 RepID=UPI003CF59420